MRLGYGRELGLLRAVIRGTEEVPTHFYFVTSAYLRFGGLHAEPGYRTSRALQTNGRGRRAAWDDGEDIVMQADVKRWVELDRQGAPLAGYDS